MDGGRYWGASVSDSGFSVESKLATGSNPDIQVVIKHI